VPIAADAVEADHEAGLALAEVPLTGQVDGQEDHHEGAEAVDQRTDPQEPELPRQSTRGLPKPTAHVISP